MNMNETSNEHFRERWLSHLKALRGELDVDQTLGAEDTLTNVSSP